MRAHRSGTCLFVAGACIGLELGIGGCLRNRTGVVSEVAQAAAAESQCFSGPLNVQVLDLHGRPAANVPVGFSDIIWWPQQAGEVPRRRVDRRTDADGSYHWEQVTECDWPSAVYAWDESNASSGIVLIENGAELSKTIVLRLRPSCSATGTLQSTDAEGRGFQPEAYCAHLAPVARGRAAARGLRLIRDRPGEFRFLVPPGVYELNVQGSRLEWRQGIRLTIPPGEAACDLGVFDLHASRLTELTGSPAPEWSVSQWCDGAERGLATYKGRYVLLCFWQKNSGTHGSLPQIRAWSDRLAEGAATTILIHAAEPGGLPSLQRHLDRNHLLEGLEGFDPSMSRWPFVVGMDAPSSSRNRSESVSFGESHDRYGIRSFPCGVLIDPGGRVVADSTMPSGQWQQALEQARASSDTRRAD